VLRYPSCSIASQLSAQASSVTRYKMLFPNPSNMSIPWMNGYSSRHAHIKPIEGRQKHSGALAVAWAG
jgi:hypothetical protein